MNNYSVEIQRNNVTPAKFFAEIRFALKKKGIDFHLNLKDFANPSEPHLMSYNVIDDKKHILSGNYVTTTHFRRKLAYHTTERGTINVYHTDEFEEYEETKWVTRSRTEQADDAPCKSEIINLRPYEYQIYVLNFDGSCYNEICEFTFHDDKTGYGYYYTLNKNAE